MHLRWIVVVRLQTEAKSPPPTRMRVRGRGSAHRDFGPVCHVNRTVWRILSASTENKRPTGVVVCDVGPRDGLQNEGVTLSPSVRAELCGRLAEAGLRRVEAVSFVREDRVPQMAGAEEVLCELDDRVAETEISALVLNPRGLERALAAGITAVHVAVMATESFARANVNRSRDEAAEAAFELTRRAVAEGATVAGTVSVAFGCPFEGRVDPGVVQDLLGELAAAGAQELMLADTIGIAAPTQVRRAVERAMTYSRPVGVHLHDTRNTAVANTMAALDAGATLLESSVGGAGGCPFAPGATGNLATEDLLWVLEREGVQTGADVAAVVEIAHWLEQQLERPLPGSLSRPGCVPMAV
jgi:hydroxymethylglutaryl-CoA lyase/(R)-citramalyl-CoA lyase